MRINRYGLGCDQIIGAKIVNAQGDEVEASPDVLYGIRGAQGGPFGIVTELKLKVYPFTTVRLPLSPPLFFRLL